MFFIAEVLFVCGINQSHGLMWPGEKNQRKQLFYTIFRL